MFYLKVDKSKNIRVLLFYYLFGLFLMSYASICVLLQEPNIWTYNILFLAGAVCIGYYFNNIIVSQYKKVIIRFIVMIDIVYYVGRNFIGAQMLTFDSVGYSLLSITIVCFSFFYVDQRFKNVDESKIYNTPHFWIIGGYLLFYISGFFIFCTFYYLTHKIMSTYTQQERELLTLLWGVHNVLLFLSALTTLSGSIWIVSRKKLI